MMNYCMKCGAPVAQGAGYCPRCGFDLSGPPPGPPPDMPGAYGPGYYGPPQAHGYVGGGPPPPTGPPPQLHYQPPPPPPRSGASPALVVGVFVVVIILILAIGIGYWFTNLRASNKTPEKKKDKDPQPVEGPPFVISTDPRDGERGVSLTPTFTIEWNEPMNQIEDFHETMVVEPYEYGGFVGADDSWWENSTTVVVEFYSWELDPYTTFNVSIRYAYLYEVHDSDDEYPEYVDDEEFIVHEWRVTTGAY